MSALSAEGFDATDHVLARSADLRYLGQAFEVRVAAPPGSVDEDFSADVLARFHDEHERLYGYCYRDDPTQTVEWVNLRATGIGPITRPDIRELPPGDGDPERARTGERDVYFEEAWHSTALYDRTGLRAGDEVLGPAVIEEYGSTLPLPPGFAGLVDGRSNIIVRRERS